MLLKNSDLENYYKANFNCAIGEKLKIMIKKSKLVKTIIGSD